MYKTKKKYLPIFVLFVCTAFVLIIYKLFFGAVQKPYQVVKNTSLVKASDRAPIKISRLTIKKGRALNLPILMYHHVGQAPANANSTRKDLTVPIKDFQAEVNWLDAQDYQSITLHDLYLYSLGNFALPKKPIIFTFDDGYEDVFQNAVPILKQHNFIGSFAIITQWPGQTQGDNVYASWDDIKTAQSLGMEIVCHTQNHFDGTNLKFDSNYVFQNLSGCKKDLIDHNIDTNILIYPYGHYSPDYITQAKKAGFVTGVTVHEGDTINLDNLMEVPRIRVHGAEALDQFIKIISKNS